MIEEAQRAGVDRFVMPGVATLFDVDTGRAEDPLGPAGATIPV